MSCLLDSNAGKGGTVLEDTNDPDDFEQNATAAAQHRRPHRRSMSVSKLSEELSFVGLSAALTAALPNDVERDDVHDERTITTCTSMCLRRKPLRHDGRLQVIRASSDFYGSPSYTWIQ